MCDKILNKCNIVGNTMPEINAKVMVEAAIKTKIDEGFSQNEAQKYVAASLFRYMRKGELSILTSAGGLRDAFSASPDMDVLVFIGQINFDLDDVLKEMANLITREFQRNKKLVVSEAQHELFEMLDKYQRERQIEYITRTAKLRDLISRKILNVEKLKKIFSDLLDAYADETEKKMNEIIDRVKDNHLDLLKHHFEKFKHKLSMARVNKELIGTIDLSSKAKHKDIEILQKVLSATDYHQMQEIAIQANKELLRANTNFQMMSMLGAFKYNDTAVCTLIKLKADISSSFCDSEKMAFAQMIYHLSEEVSSYAYAGVCVPGYQFTYLTAILSASDIQQVKELTAWAAKLPEIRRFDHAIRQVMIHIEESDTFEELNAKMPNRLSIR